MLRNFYMDEELRNEVQNYLNTYLKEKAIEKVFNREDTSAIAEAKEMIDGAFENLSVLFPKKAKKTLGDEAR